ncbi:MAG: YbgA family protein [Thermodesulfobacteriota bacterium]
MEKQIKLGISTCLLGQKVRYDGGHKLDRFLTDTLGKYVDYVPVCPEVECGFGIPREAFRLVGDPDSPRLITSRTHQDCTDRMMLWGRKRVVELEAEGICGFIFKSNSPSSGMERVKVYTEKGMPVKKGRGIFARIFIEHFPLIPVEEEGRLHDPRLRENFIERIFALKRWRETLSKELRMADLVKFHTHHKLLILSHSEKHYRTMGKLVAAGKEMPLKELYARYEALLMEALQLKTTPKKNSNVLMHMMGYFKKQFTPDEKQELLEIIRQYSDGYIPLMVPITLINHYVRKYNQPYLREQTYLHPHPVELQLRNHV